MRHNISRTPNPQLKIHYVENSELFTLEHLSALLWHHLPAAGLIQFGWKLADHLGMDKDALVEDTLTSIIREYGETTAYAYPNDVWLSNKRVRLVTLGKRTPNYPREFAHLMWTGIPALTFHLFWKEAEKRLHEQQERDGKIWADGERHPVYGVVAKAAEELAEELSEGG